MSYDVDEIEIRNRNVFRNFILRICETIEPRTTESLFCNLKQLTLKTVTHILIRLSIIFANTQKK